MKSCKRRYCGGSLSEEEEGEKKKTHEPCLCTDDTGVARK
jgi:hypothetical protein